MLIIMANIYIFNVNYNNIHILNIIYNDEYLYFQCSIATIFSTPHFYLSKKIISLHSCVASSVPNEYYQFIHNYMVS